MKTRLFLTQLLVSPEWEAHIERLIISVKITNLLSMFQPTGRAGPGYSVWL
jgi:hypothetical protein